MIKQTLKEKTFKQKYPVTIPTFAEAHHDLVREIQHYSDAELVLHHRQAATQQAKFFVALFCRYSSITYSIIQHVAGDHLQIDYLFALAWQRVFDQLAELEEWEIDKIQWQNWIVSTAGELVGTEALPPSDRITYRLQAVSPPLRCFVERSLELMPPLLRLVLIAAEQWHWSAAKISNQLAEIGEEVSEMDVPLYISESQSTFTKNLPDDLLEIYRATSSILADESLDIDTLGNIVSKSAARSSS
jgi:hypothetical protein